MESQVSRNAQADIPTVQKTRYGYDPFGRRLVKRDAFGVTRFVWDGNRLLSETRGSQVRTWVYEPDSFVPIAQVESTAGTGTQDDGQAQQAHNVGYIHTDHLGTPRELTSDAGEIVWAGVYRAWGNLAIAAMPVAQGAIAPDQDTTAESSAFTDAMPLRFQGQYYDSETGLHYNRFRYYDPDTGRFVSQDPIGLQGGNNQYQYAPNPTGWVDPFGLTCNCGTRFINGVEIVDQRTGNVLKGTVDLVPTLDRIASGTRFPHRNDGSIFRNRPLPGKTVPELPVKPLGYYTEYVHPTPGLSGPGPQRIVLGSDGEKYYTPDHYGSFILLNR